MPGRKKKQAKDFAHSPRKTATCVFRFHEFKSSFECLLGRRGTVFRTNTVVDISSCKCCLCASLFWIEFTEDGKNFEVTGVSIATLAKCSRNEHSVTESQLVPASFWTIFWLECGNRFFALCSIFHSAQFFLTGGIILDCVEYWVPRQGEQQRNCPVLVPLRTLRKKDCADSTHKEGREMNPIS